MRAGNLSRRISIQRRTDTQDSAGQPIPTWTQIGSVRWAERKPAGGYEKFGAEQFLAREQVVWEVRYSSDLSGLNPKDRIVYPVPGLDETPADSHIYEILAVSEIGRFQGLKILTARRSEF